MPQKIKYKKTSVLYNYPLKPLYLFKVDAKFTHESFNGYEYMRDFSIYVAATKEQHAVRLASRCAKKWCISELRDVTTISLGLLSAQELVHERK